MSDQTIWSSQTGDAATVSRQLPDEHLVDPVPSPCSWALHDLDASPAYRGTIEFINADGIGGWCLHGLDPAAPVILEVMFHGFRLCTHKTGMSRPDICDVLGMQVAPGFSIPWSMVNLSIADTMTLVEQAQIVPWARAALTVNVVGGQGLFLPLLPGAQATLTNAQLAEIIQQQLMPTGGIDGIEQLSVHGHIDWPHSDQTATAVLTVDGIVVETGPTLSAGYNALQFTLPDTLVDGQSHRIAVALADAPEAAIGATVEQHFSLIADASWSVKGSLLEGWLVGLCDRDAVALNIEADGVPLSVMRVAVKAGQCIAFSRTLPIQLVDGAVHELRVVVEEEPGNFLPYLYGGVTHAYCRRIAMAVDTMSNGWIRGWAFNRTDPTADIEVELWEGPVLLSRTVPNSIRPDVNQLYDITGNHGFSFTIPGGFFDGLAHRLTLMAGGEEITVPVEKRLPGILGRGLLARTNLRYAGKVEVVTASEISGWAANLFAPYEPVSLSIFVDGVCEATILAEQFQKRLQVVAGSGYHSFHYRFPAHLMNNQEHTIEVRFSDGNMPLEFLLGGQRSRQAQVHFPLINFFAATESPATRSDPMPRQISNLVHGQPKSMPAVPLDSGQPLVSFIVLNWNGATLLDQFLASIATHMSGESLELLIVDHGSQDDSLQVVERYRSRLDIQLLDRGANFSFSASNNFAARQARGRYLFLVNNDLVFPSNCLPTLTAWLENDPTIGIVGAGLLEPLPSTNGEWRYAPHHRGIQFMPRLRAGDDLTYGPMELFDAYSALGAAFEVPAVTGAALLCRREEFLAIGGLDEMYFYGMEDIDVCLRLSRHFHSRIVCDLSATILHNRSYTRTGRLVTGKPNPVLTQSSTQIQNTLMFSRRFKRHATHQTLASLIDGKTSWRMQPLRVTIIVTEVSMVTPAGDFFTALEMADALRNQFGWEVLFALNDATDLAGTDVLIVMRHDFNIKAIKGCNPGVVTVAWIRNRVDQWLATRYFQAYNLIFCSSELAVDTIAQATGRTAHLLPIATNPERFHPRPPVEEHRTDIVFTGSSHAGTRDAIGLLDDVELPGQLAIYGFGWDRQPRWSGHWRGARPYWDLPDIYPAAKLVIDDSHPVTREWNSLNSRIFDALASGTLVVTNCQGGSDELFGGKIPTFTNSTDLAATLTYYMDHPAEREALAAELRAEVLSKHTYAHRAQSFKDALSAFVRTSLRFAIKVAATNPNDRDTSEGWQIALALEKALRRAGHYARIDLLPDWAFNESAGDDVVIVLRGAATFEPKPSKINILWMINRPDEVSAAEMAQYDHVFTSSGMLVDRLRYRLGNRISTLLPCVDPQVFYPVDTDEGMGCDIAFVGRGNEGRPEIVDAALQAGLDIAVFGQKWDGIVPPQAQRQTSLAAAERRNYYSNAKVVLHQHSQSMRVDGMLSVWLLEAGACGATIISDDLPGMAELFDSNVAISRDPIELAGLTKKLLADDVLRKKMGTELRRIILEQHTADHRVKEILTIVQKFL